MNKQEKNQQIDSLAEKLTNNSNFYLADISDLTVEATNKLRRECFNKKISVHVVKNTLLKKAMEKTPGKYDEMFPAFKGSTAIMFTEVANEPAKIIKEFLKKNPKATKPQLKAAFLEESVYLGHDQLDNLASIKSKNELIGDIIGLLQSPAKNVISGLKGQAGKIAGVLETLSKKSE